MKKAEQKNKTISTKWRFVQSHETFHVIECNTIRRHLDIPRNKLKFYENSIKIHFVPVLKQTFNFFKVEVGGQSKLKHFVLGHLGLISHHSIIFLKF